MGQKLRLGQVGTNSGPTLQYKKYFFYFFFIFFQPKNTTLLLLPPYPLFLVLFNNYGTIF